MQFPCYKTLQKRFGWSAAFRCGSGIEKFNLPNVILYQPTNHLFNKEWLLASTILPYTKLNSSVHAKTVYLSFFQIKLEIWAISKNFVVVYSPKTDISYGNIFWSEIFPQFSVGLKGRSNKFFTRKIAQNRTLSLLHTRIYCKLTWGSTKWKKNVLQAVK